MMPVIMTCLCSVSRVGHLGAICIKDCPPICRLTDDILDRYEDVINTALNTADDDKLYVVVPEGVKPVRIGFDDGT